MLVDAALVWGLAATGEGMFDEVPTQERDDHHGDCGGEVVAYTGVARVGLEDVDVHAEEAADEGEGEEDECYPAERGSVNFSMGGRAANLSRHMLVFSCRPCLLSLMPTDLYIKSARLAVGLVKFSSTKSLIFSMLPGTASSQSLSPSSSLLKSLRFCCISFTTASWVETSLSTLSHMLELVQSSGARDSSAGCS